MTIPLFFILLLHFYVFTQSRVVVINSSSIPDFSNPSSMTYSNFSDFLNGINNKSLLIDYYEVIVQTNAIINGKFSIENYNLNIKLFFFIFL